MAQHSGVVHLNIYRNDTKHHLSPHRYQPTPPFTYILTYTLYLHSYFTWCYCLTTINQVMHSDQIKMYPRQIKYYTLIYYSSLVSTMWPQLSHTSICGIICTFKSINVLYILYHISTYILYIPMLCAYDVCNIYVYVLLYTSGALHALSSLYQFTDRSTSIF